MKKTSYPLFFFCVFLTLLNIVLTVSCAVFYSQVLSMTFKLKPVYNASLEIIPDIGQQQWDLGQKGRITTRDKELIWIDQNLGKGKVRYQFEWHSEFPDGWYPIRSHHLKIELWLGSVQKPNIFPETHLTHNDALHGLHWSNELTYISPSGITGYYDFDLSLYGSGSYTIKIFISKFSTNQY